MIQFVASLNFHRLKFTNHRLFLLRVIVECLSRHLFVVFQPFFKILLLSYSISINCIRVGALADRAPTNVLISSSDRSTRNKFNFLTGLIGLLGLQNRKEACITCDRVRMEEFLVAWGIFYITFLCGSLLEDFNMLSLDRHRVICIVFHRKTKFKLVLVPSLRIPGLHVNSHRNKPNPICQHLVRHRRCVRSDFDIRCGTGVIHF